MISPLSSGHIQPNNRLHASAMKVFGEADGDAAAVVPGLEDSYDDLACEFLSSWLTEKPSFEAPQTDSAPQGVTTSSAAEPPNAPAPQSTPRFTAFSLGQEWNIVS